jgi:hypothetical protein
MAMLAAGGMTVFSAALQKKQRVDTENKMVAIQKALLDYRNAMNRIPCPADITPALTSGNFGIEGATAGTCTGGTPAANFSSGNNVQGMVPTKTLRLPDDYAFDGWGRRIMYAVDKRFTNTNGFTTYNISAAGALTITFGSTGGSPINFSLPANGGSVSASSTYSGGGATFPASGAINGDRTGVVWGVNGGWNDDTNGVYPDWLEVDFSGTKNISEIDLFGVQDSYASPSTPTLSMTFTLYGLYTFQVQYWDGSTWQVVPGASLVANNKVWNQFSFSPISTTKVRVYITASAPGDTWSRVVELEAWGTTGVSSTAVYALTSMGADGHGAYPRNGGATRISSSSVNTDEQQNCDCNSSGVTTSFDGTFVQKLPTQDATTANRTNDFDDIVVYATRNQLASPTE